MPIEDFFRKDDVAGNHPLLSFVATRLKAGDDAVFELYRPPEGLGYRKAKIYVHLIRGGQEVDCKADDWDDDLNDGLVHLGVRADSPEGEKGRFALGLRASLRKPEKRFGDGYFNSVLIEFALESDFSARPEVEEVLKHIPHASPYKGRGYADCRAMIGHAIRGRALELANELKYSLPEAADVLSGALARYLDERFSVSSRRLLGFL
jgi:hypothetical protein